MYTYTYNVSYLYFFMYTYTYTYPFFMYTYTYTCPFLCTRTLTMCNTYTFLCTFILILIIFYVYLYLYFFMIFILMVGAVLCAGGGVQDPLHHEGQIHREGIGGHHEALHVLPRRPRGAAAREDPEAPEKDARSGRLRRGPGRLHQGSPEMRYREAVRVRRRGCLYPHPGLRAIPRGTHTHTHTHTITHTLMYTHTTPRT
jgi:hypothetical protein